MMMPLLLGDIPIRVREDIRGIVAAAARNTGLTPALESDGRPQRPTARAIPATHSPMSNRCDRNRRIGTQA
jgi:hypothetical protein